MMTAWQAAGPLHARGTPAYLPPEGWCGSSALRKRPVALKADVYALAMILYKLETGVLPWHSMSEWSIFLAVCNYGQRPAWPACVERVPGPRELIEDCRGQDYRDRPTCREVARRLQGLVENLGAAKEAKETGANACHERQEIANNARVIDKFSNNPKPRLVRVFARLSFHRFYALHKHLVLNKQKTKEDE